jgi:hypothetical protein
VFGIILMRFELGNCRCEMSVRASLAVFVFLNACGFHCNFRSGKQRKKSQLLNCRAIYQGNVMEA